MKPSTACLTALLGCFLLAGVMVGGSCLSEGVSMGQRVMTDLAMPVGLAWLAAFGGMLYQWRRQNPLAARGFAMAFLAIGVLFSPLVSGLLVTALEAPPLSPPPLSREGSVYDIVIVLGGGARRDAAGQAELTSAGERLALAAKMWHAGKAQAIICTGTIKPRPLHSEHTEEISYASDDPAEVGQEILAALAVPTDRLYRCAGENTAAEMRHLSNFFNALPSELPAKPSVGLVTSAFHLPRAMRLAKAADLDFEPLPAGTRGLTGNIRGIGILVPTAGAGDALAMVAKEWLARLIGR